MVTVTSTPIQPINGTAHNLPTYIRKSTGSKARVYTPLLHLHSPEESVHERRFAGPRTSHDAHPGSGRYMEREVVKNGRVRRCVLSKLTEGATSHSTWRRKWKGKFETILTRIRFPSNSKLIVFLTWVEALEMPKRHGNVECVHAEA